MTSVVLSANEQKEQKKDQEDHIRRIKELQKQQQKELKELQKEQKKEQEEHCKKLKELQKQQKKEQEEHCKKIKANKQEVLDRLKTVVVQFLEELIEKFDKESDLVILRIFFQYHVPIEDVAQHFITHILPYKEQIKKRNDRFFLENDDIFNPLDQKDKVIHFKKLWLSPQLYTEDRDVIWKYFDVIVKIVELYKKIVEENK